MGHGQQVHNIFFRQNKRRFKHDQMSNHFLCVDYRVSRDHFYVQNMNELIWEIKINNLCFGLSLKKLSSTICYM
jgi:hypothetical protein